jgi:hypothetical protein
MSYEWLDTRKCCHAKLYEKADPLKELGSVARFLGNRIFILINDTKHFLIHTKRHVSADREANENSIFRASAAFEGYFHRSSL